VSGVRGESAAAGAGWTGAAVSDTRQRQLQEVEMKDSKWTLIDLMH
jgi:hypothetical protein